MSDGRTAILSQIRARLGGALPTPEAMVAARTRALTDAPAPIPARGQLVGPAREAMFCEMATHARASVEVVADQAAAAAAVAAWMAAHEQGHELCVSADAAPMADALERAGLVLRCDVPEADGAVVLTSAFAGVAETGTLVACCGQGRPHTLHILARHHLVVLDRARITANYEACFDLLAAERPGLLPRALLWITGPSRTGDIEQTMQLGAHGPKSLHIILHG